MHRRPAAGSGIPTGLFNYCNTLAVRLVCALRPHCARATPAVPTLLRVRSQATAVRAIPTACLRPRSDQENCGQPAAHPASSRIDCAQAAGASPQPISPRLSPKQQPREKKAAIPGLLSGPLLRYRLHTYPLTTRRRAPASTCHAPTPPIPRAAPGARCPQTKAPHLRVPPSQGRPRQNAAAHRTAAQLHPPMPRPNTARFPQPARPLPPRPHAHGVECARVTRTRGT